MMFLRHLLCVLGLRPDYTERHLHHAASARGARSFCVENDLRKTVEMAVVED